jgi:hypothetical protein
MWTRFMDMHSGGRAKVKNGDVEVCYIYIEAGEAEACQLFEKFFERDPRNETCNCCGGDYSIGEEESLEQATAFERGCAYSDAENRFVERPNKHNRYKPLDVFLDDPSVIVVRRDEQSKMLPPRRTA